jgi:hypothetical protein
VAPTGGGNGPTVTRVQPDHGQATSMVVISGTNLAGALSVQFGGHSARFARVQGAIIALAPSGVTGTVDITVTTQGGTSATSQADHFTYVNHSGWGAWVAGWWFWQWLGR